MASRGNDRALTPKQSRFVDEFLKDMIAKDAAIRSGYSKKTADVIGYQLLHNPLVSAEIQRRIAKVSKKVEITKERILAEYAKIAFSNMQDLADWNQSGVTLKPSDELTRRKSAAISEVSETVNNAGFKALKIKLHDKKGALDSLAKHLGLLIDKHEVTGKDGKPLSIKLEPEHDLSKLSPQELMLFRQLSEKIATDTSEKE